MGRNFHVNYNFSLQAKGNAVMQAGLETRKKALHERRLALEQDVLFSYWRYFIFFSFSFFFPKRTFTHSHTPVLMHTHYSCVVFNLNVLNAIFWSFWCADFNWIMYLVTKCDEEGLIWVLIVLTGSQTTGTIAKRKRLEEHSWRRNSNFSMAFTCFSHYWWKG